MTICDTVPILPLRSVTLTLSICLKKRSVTGNVIVESVLAVPQLVVVKAAPPTNRVTSHAHTRSGCGNEHIGNTNNHSSLLVVMSYVITIISYVRRI